MTSINRYRLVLTITLMLAGLVILFSTEGYSTTTAQSAAVFVKDVRAFDADSIGTLNPVGLAFSPVANEFLVLEAVSSGGTPSAKSDFIRIAPGEERRGFVSVAASINDPINMTFDSKFQRLLFLRSAHSNLFELAVDSQGLLLAGTLKPHNANKLGIQDPQGMVTDPANGDLFILNGTGPQLLHIVPDAQGGFADAVVTEVDLGHTGLVSPRGLALDPTSGHLYILNSVLQELFEVTKTGQVVAIHTLTGTDLNINNPQGMVFAPSGDTTDDPAKLNLYLADSAQTGNLSGMQSENVDAVGAEQTVESAEALEAVQTATDSGQLVELAFAPVVAAVAADTTANWVQTIDTFSWSPPSPDPSGVAFIPAFNTLLVSDGEVNEMPIYSGINVFESTLSGTFIPSGSFTTLDFGNNEPTGISIDPTTEHLFISRDTPPKEVFEIDPGTDHEYNTIDDTVTSVVTADFGSTDPEGVTFATGLGVLFIADGLNNEVYQLGPGPNGVFDGTNSPGDDQVIGQFDTASLGMDDPEGIVYNPTSGNLYLGGKTSNIGSRNFDTLLEVSSSGSLIQTIDVSAVNPDNIYPKQKLSGLAIGPCSNNPNRDCIYISDRGEDNNNDPNENDGRVYEVSLPVSPGNQPPSVNAGPDQVITLPAGAALDGTVGDDGLPAPPSLTSTWSMVSGPGMVTFGDANAVDTTASFSLDGSYILRLVASDGELSASDELTITVNNDPNQNLAPNVNAGLDQTIAVSDLATLDGTVSDDGLPATPGTVMTTWSQVGGPGTVTFADANAVDTTADFSTTGLYILRLTANDGELSAFDDVAITAVDEQSVLTIFVSSTSGGNAGGVVFGDEDVLAFDTTTGSWSMYFDGSDVGLVTSGDDIDAFHINADGSILLSLSDPATLPDVGTIDDSDIVRFIPTSTGPTTAGTYEWYVDGSDVELLDSGEDIDAIGFVADGRLAISTSGSFSVNGLSGKDEDLIIFTATTLGATTSGSWEAYFDGSAPGIALDTTSSEDVAGTWFGDNGDIYLTTRGDFSVPLMNGDGADIFACLPGSTGVVTSCTYSLFWDGSANGFTGEIVGAFAFKTLTSQSNQPPTANAGPDQNITLPNAATLAGTATDDGLPSPPSLSTVWSVVSGPGTVTFANGSALDTTVTFSVDGDYTLRLTADDGLLTAADDVLITVNPEPPNQPPTANAGPDQNVTLPDAATLAGTATDDGLPSPPSLSTVWSVVSGPGTVTFANGSALDTTVIFSMDGDYTLRLTADDGLLTATDDVLITVDPEPPNQPPTANAGPDQNITLPNAATLAGTATDDGLPSPPSLSTVWSVVSGPGTVTFANGSALDTTVTFSVDGDYTLRLTADDGLLTATDDVLITVDPEPPNQPPTANAGPDQSITLPNAATLAGTATDDGLPSPPSLSTVWSVVSGPGTVTFANGSALDTTVTFSVDGDYTLRLTADDGLLTATDDVLITVGPNPISTTIIYVSSSSSGTVGGIDFKDEDILTYDLNTNTWSMYFDGSDVGANVGDIDAFHLDTDGSMLLSFTNAVTLPDVGAIDDSDIVRFIPTSTGTLTAGSYQWFFHAADVELAANGEDIDAIGFAPDGRLVISTTGSYRVSGIAGADEDLLIFTGTTGATTSGTLGLYFDGSDVGLNTTSVEDINGTWIDANGDIYLTTLGAFAVIGAAGDAADIFTCSLGSTGENTSCAFAPFWDGSADGLAGIVDAIMLAP